MPRPRTGRLRVKDTSRGRSFGVRFKIGPQEHFVQLGGEWEGWTEEQALAQMQVLMRQVDRGEWKPPEPPAAPAEPEPTSQVFASIWLDRRQRRLAPKSVKQYEWAHGHLLDFFGDDRLPQISAARIDKYVDVKLRERDELVAANHGGDPFTRRCSHRRARGVSAGARSRTGPSTRRSTSSHACSRRRRSTAGSAPTRRPSPSGGSSCSGRSAASSSPSRSPPCSRRPLRSSGRTAASTGSRSR
jgi:hypothetical protein